MFIWCLNVCYFDVYLTSKHSSLQCWCCWVLCLLDVVLNLKTLTVTFMHNINICHTLWITWMFHILWINFLDFNLQIHHETTLQTHCWINLYINMNKMHISLKISCHINCMNHRTVVAIQFYSLYKMNLMIKLESTTLLLTLLKISLMKFTKCIIITQQTIHTNSSQNILTVAFISTCTTSLLNICDRKNTVIRDLHSNYYEFLWRV